jgi:hypothetical protein
MLLSILIAIGACAILAFSILLFSPLRLSFAGSFTEQERGFELFFSWLHPSVLRCVLDGNKRSYSIIVLGRFRLFSSEEDQIPETASVMGTGGTERVPHDGPVMEKPAPPGKGEETHDHVSKGPTEQEKPRRKQKRESVDKDKKEKDDGDSGREAGGLFGFLRRPRVRKVMVFLRDAWWRDKIIRWLKASIVRFFHIVSVTRFRLHVKLGLSDPCQVGRAYGYYIAVKNALMDTGTRARNSRKEISFEPVFNQEIADADGSIEISSSVARICLPVVLAVVTFPYFHTLILYFRTRRIK